MSVTLQFTLANRSFEKTWDDVSPEFAVSDLGMFLQLSDERKEKEGKCFVPGRLVGSDRKAHAVVEICVLVYDVDGKQKMEGEGGLREKLEASGHLAWVYTSHSHGSTETQIKTDAYKKWATQNGAAFPPTIVEMRDYLESKDKGYLEDLQFDLAGDMKRHVEQTNDGLIYKVQHAPVEKYRVLFPLAEKIIVANEGGTTAEMLAGYKAIYHGVGQHFGLQYDAACEDPSRLYYWPSHKPGTTYQRFWEFGSEDNLLDYNRYPRATIKRERQQRTTSTGKPIESHNRLVVGDKNGVPINLLAWEHKNRDFDIEDLLTRCLPEDMIRKTRDKGGFIVECPFESNHSQPGGLGTFAANGDGDHSWAIACSHASCKDAGNGKLDYLAEYIRMGYITAEDLGVTLREKEKPSREAIAAAIGVDPSTLPNDMNILDDDEEEESLATVGERGSEIGDDDLSTTEVYDIAKNDVIGALDAATALRAVNRMRARGCAIDIEDIIQLVAKSEMRGESVRRLFRSLVKHFNFDVEDAAVAVKTWRGANRDMPSDILDIHREALTGDMLIHRLKKVADYYMRAFDDIRTQYEEVNGQTLLNDHGATLEAHFRELSRKYAKVRLGQNLFILDKLGSWEKGEIIKLLPGAMSNLKRNVNVKDVDKKGKVAVKYVYDEWMRDDKTIEEYDGITFNPKAGKLHEGKFNLWNQTNGRQGFAIKPIAGDCSIVLDHIKGIWCNGDEQLYNWVVTWLAHIVQHPAGVCHTAIVLLGPPGTGKSIIMEYGMSRILGAFYGKSAQSKGLTGSFNAHLAFKLLFTAEEALFSGDKAGAQVMKDLITSSTIDLEPKGVDRFSIPKFTRFIFTSNEVHALHLDADDRRFVVLDTATTRQNDHDHFTKMRVYLEDKGANHLLHFLLNWKPEEVGLTWDAPTRPVHTKMKEAQADMSLGVGERFFLQLLRFGRPQDMPESLPREARVSWPLNSELHINPRKLRECYHQFCTHNQGNYDKKKFEGLWAKYIGGNRVFNESAKVRRLNAHKVERQIEHPTRKQALELALKARVVRERDLELAYEDVESHIWTEENDFI